MPLLELLGFDQDHMQRLHHQLASHPLMQPDRLADLALRLDPQFVRFHDGERTVASDMNTILSSDPQRTRLRSTLENLHKARAFVQIINIRADPEYRAVVDQCLAEIERVLPPGDRLMNRDASAFLASPGSVTPFHLDHEQNVLCHLRGAKTLLVWNHTDRGVVDETSLETFFRDGTQNGVGYRPEVQKTAAAFELQPGDAVYMPMGSPHAVQTGSDVTATFSVLFNTKVAVRRANAYRANHVFRGLGLAPTPVGASATVDSIKGNLFKVFRTAKYLSHGRIPDNGAKWY